MDDLRSKTDKTLAAMERRLTKIFAQAEKEIAEAWDAYMVSIADKIDVYEKEYQAAKESGDPDEKRRTGIRLAKAKQEQTLYNARYQAMVKQTAAKIADVNEIALDYINGQMPKVYAMNYNGTTQEIKADVAGASVNVGQYSFDLVDEATVKALIMDDPNLVPQKYLNRMRDIGWNTKSINSQVLQGILQGESIPKIAGRLENVVGMDANAAIRNARTMTTAAENNGRMEGIKAAESQGIVYKKTWMATHDARTRDAHADLDGVTVEIDDAFPNGLQFPGDPHGPASEIYNCRCSMVRKLVGFRRADGSISEVNVKGYEPTYFDDRPKAETPAPTEPKPKQEEKHFSFTPATTKDEAKDYIAQYVDATKFGALGVDYTGIDLEVQNTINETIGRLQETYNVPKFGGIKAPAGNTKEGKMIQAASAAYSSVRDSFYLNRKVLGDAKTASTALKKEAEAIAAIVNNPQNYDLSKLRPQVRKIIEDSMTSKRATVPTTIEEVIYHEYGHRLERFMSKDDVLKIKERMADYAPNISGYACQDVSEYIAESFCCYNKGETEIVDTFLKGIFEDMKRR